MTPASAAISALLLASLLLAGCGEQTCKTICSHCDAVEQADCREACTDAYSSTASCRREMRDLEDCLSRGSCDSVSCRDELNLVSSACGFDVRDYAPSDGTEG
jgi:hypothetical protein